MINIITIFRRKKQPIFKYLVVKDAKRLKNNRKTEVQMKCNEEIVVVQSSGQTSLTGWERENIEIFLQSWILVYSLDQLPIKKNIKFNRKQKQN